VQGFLGETDTTVGQELRGFDPPDRVLDQVAELLALCVADGYPIPLCPHTSTTPQHSVPAPYQGV